MASMVARGDSSSQMSPVLSVQEKGSRNKRKYRADSLSVESNDSTQNECLTYEFSAEKFNNTLSHGQSGSCDLCGVSQDQPHSLKLDLELVEESLDADWNDLTENQLEELVLSNLDTIFNTAIQQIVACGYTEEVATNATLRSGICYGSKDMVSNIVENSLAILKNGQDMNLSMENIFEDLKQLEKYILAELVCVLREVKPFFSIGDAMWCLLICDMNVSHACAMDSDPPRNSVGDAAPSDGTTSTLPLESQLKIEPENSIPSPPVVPNTTKLRNSAADKEAKNSAFDKVDKSHASVHEEKFSGSKKAHSGSIKREYILRQKSLHLEKSYRTYGSKGSLRAGKLSGLGGLILDKKLKSVSESTAVNIRNASIKISKAMGVDVAISTRNLPNNPGSSSPFHAVPHVTIPTPSIIIPPTNPSLAVPAVSSPPADTELSLSLPSKSSVNCVSTTPTCTSAGIPYDKTLRQWVPRDKKDEMILKLVPKVRELQNQLQEWTEWANNKVMQAARRLGKDKEELKLLRQEKDEVERLKKEKQGLEESTMKKLAEMENAWSKASGQVEKANLAVCMLEGHNAALRQEMKIASLRAAKSAMSCQEAVNREKKNLMKCQSWEKQKIVFQEELATEKIKVSQLLQEVELAKQLEVQHEARWQHEKKAREELLLQATSLKKEREQTETSTKSKEDHIKMKADTNMKKYKDDIQKLEKEISQMRLKTDSSKIAALRRGVDGSYASKFTDIQKESWELATDYNAYSNTGGVKRERECVMCLSEEMSVVFLPCAHQVVCSKCNELHEKQGMKDCPSCRSTIQRRIHVRYAARS